jgi:hypothetical protein
LNLIKYFKKKLTTLLKHPKVFSFETKSTNLQVLAQDVLTSLHSLVQSLSLLHTLLSEQAENLENVSAKTTINRAQIFLLTNASKRVDLLAPSIPFEEYQGQKALNEL